MEVVAKLNDLRMSPYKVRLVVDLVRGLNVVDGLAVLKNVQKKCSLYVEKLLLSAISNWEQKNGVLGTDYSLLITTIKVDGASMLKRLKPAPQGRGHRIRKRSCHITLVVSSFKNVVDDESKL